MPSIVIPELKAPICTFLIAPPIASSITNKSCSAGLDCAIKVENPPNATLRMSVALVEVEIPLPPEIVKVLLCDIVWSVPLSPETSKVVN